MDRGPARPLKGVGRALVFSANGTALRPVQRIPGALARLKAPGFPAKRVWHPPAPGDGRFVGDSFRKSTFFAPRGVAPGMRFWHGPADLRPPFWAGKASFLCACRARGEGVGLHQHL